MCSTIICQTLAIIQSHGELGLGVRVAWMHVLPGTSWQIVWKLCFFFSSKV